MLLEHETIYMRGVMSDSLSESVREEPVAPLATGIFQYQELIESRLGQPIATEILAAEAEKSALSPGAKLATARTALGWSIDEVASQLKLAKRQIVAIEADDYASLPEPAVIRGFIRAYAKLLKLDAAPLLIPINADSLQVKLEQATKLGKARSPFPLKSLAFSVIFLLIILLIALSFKSW